MPVGDRFLVRQAGESSSHDSSLRLVTGWFFEVVEKTRK
jgi:hypothetical protein